MAFSLKHCILLLAAAVAVCIQLNNAQYIPGRCVCPKTVKYTAENITDFQIIEPGSSCGSMQVIVTLWRADNSTSMLCLDPDRRLARAFITCWNSRINREESKKVTCLNKRKNKSQ